MILKSIRSTKLFYLSLLFILLCIGSFPSQATLSDNYIYDVWTSKDGLPHNSINAITQTEDGYLWFATWEGIARFNGKEFKIFIRGEESTLSDSGVRTLYSNSDGSLLAGGARGGLVERMPYHWQAMTPIKNLINTVLRDNNGGLWVGLQGDGLVFRKTENAEDQFILPSISIYQLTLATNGDILASTSEGFYQISATDPQKIATIPELRGIPVYTAIQTSKGAVILGSKDGVWTYQHGQLERFNKQLNDVIISSIIIDQKGNYWFGSSRQGIYYFNKNKLSRFTENDGLPNNNILSLYQDRENSIWIGTSGGLIRLRHAPFTTWNQSNGLQGDFIRTTLALPNGNIMVGGSNGLNLIENNKVYSYAPLFKDHTETKNISVLSLAHRQKSGVWVGSYEHGLFKFENNQLQHIQLNNLPTQQIRAIYEDNKAQLWIGTTGGLVKYSDNEMQQVFTTKQGLPDNYIMTLTEDSQGQIWVGTGLGVSLIKENKLRTLNLEPLEQAQYVFGFYSQKEYMWITTDRGLIRYRYADDSMSIIGQKQGLPLDKLFQIVPDSMGYFWLTSNRGIWRISQQEANAVADGILSQVNFVHYNELDGMPTAQLNGGSNPAATIAPSGDIWFATAKGLIQTHPKRFSEMISTKFPTVIEKVSVDQASLNLDTKQPITLPAGTQRISISFVGLGFISSGKILYSTKLMGLESNWTQRGSIGVAEYTNLAPGNYTFMVKAYYPYHEDSINNANFSFIVNPYWWQRTWVQLSLLIMLFLGIYLSVQWRVHLLQQSELKLKNEVAQKTQALRIQSSAFERQAREDKLTGLHNRLAFDEWHKNIYSLSQTPSQLSIIMLDIDHFKQINDTYTHLEGDKVLQKVGYLFSQFEQRNCFIARWGGEEFVFGLLNWEKDKVYTLGEEINYLVKQQDYSEIDKELVVTISIGIVNSNTSNNIETLLRQADEALFEVKNNGRDGVCVYEDKNS
jgi:diguanylate cyclase (GGDEF)-like protein